MAESIIPLSKLKESSFNKRSTTGPIIVLFAKPCTIIAED